jgi:hypothetical protein
MQILARTLVTVLGIYAIVSIYASAIFSLTIAAREEPAFWRFIPLVFILIVLTVLFAFYGIFNNSPAVRLIIGSANTQFTEEQKRWLIQSLRIGLVFLGLMLLPRALPGIVKIAKIPFILRPMINDAIVTGGIPAQLKITATEWVRNTYTYLLAAMVFYLIAGAPNLVRWQLKHSAHEEPSPGQPDTPQSNPQISEGSAMNSAQSFAKVVLTAMEIYFGIAILITMPMQLTLLFAHGQNEGGIVMLVPLIISGLCLAGLFYAFAYKNDTLAQRIVGSDQLIEPAPQINRLPTAYRLVCVFAGLYCLYGAFWHLIYKMSYNMARLGFLTAEGIIDIASGLVVLTIGIYLLAGAPHFVRWQIKKTYKQCGQLTDTKQTLVT